MTPIHGDEGEEDEEGEGEAENNDAFSSSISSSMLPMKNLVNEAPIREEEEDEKEEVEEGKLSSSALPHFLISLSSHDADEALTRRQRGADSPTWRIEEEDEDEDEEGEEEEGGERAREKFLFHLSSSLFSSVNRERRLKDADRKLN